MEAENIQSVDTAPQEEPDLTSKIKYVIQMVVGCFTVMLAVRRGEDEEQGAVEDIELAMIQTGMSNEEDPDSNEADQLPATDLRLNQSAVTRNSKSLIQGTVALVFEAGSFAVMYAVPGGVNELGRAVMGDTIGFNVFLVADTLTFFASLAVAMIVATVSHMSAKMSYFISITLWAAAVCFVLTFLAAAYVVVFPNHK
ncbi:hypothetical protein SUGI_0547960 [Cryptomeria japonica]|nr:hypothetical protein SUGI_0547960 [Cryptomeria japonica]